MDDFEFTGTYTQQAGQVGNAVPPILVEAIASAILDQFYRNQDIDFVKLASNFMKFSIDNLSSMDGSLKVFA